MTFPRYPDYKDSGIEWLGEVPGHWEVRRLKQVCHAFPSNVDKKSYDDQEVVRLCNYVDVYYNDEIIDALPFMEATASKEEIAKFTLLPGDTIITKDSETADDIAIAAYVPQELPGVVCGYHLTIVRPLGDMCGRFVKRLFDSHFLKAQFEVSANGLTRVGLSQYAIDNALLPIPPAEEQSTIAAFLDRETGKIDALVAEQEKLIALLKEKRQAVISHAVTKGLDPSAPLKDSGIEWLGEVPAHWDVKQLRHITDVLRGKFTHRPRNDPAFYDGNSPFIQTGDITGSSRYITEFKQTLNEKGISVSKEFPKGTLVMAIAANIGDAAILDFPAYFPDSIVGLVPRADVSLIFAYYVLAAMKQTMLMSATVSTQMNLNVDQISALKAALPPLPEQDAIVAYLDDQTTKFDALIAEAQRAIDLLKEHRSALISAAITGKIDVRGLVPAPEEAA